MKSQTTRTLAAVVLGAVLTGGGIGLGVVIGVRVMSLGATTLAPLDTTAPAGWTGTREVVCDNVAFEDVADAYAAVQATCNDGVLVTLLD